MEILAEIWDTMPGAAKIAVVAIAIWLILGHKSSGGNGKSGGSGSNSGSSASSNSSSTSGSGTGV